MEANEFTQRVALFQNIKCNYATLTGDWAERDSDYVQISEYVEIQLEPLKRADVIAKQVEALDAQAVKVQADAERTLTEIRRRKAELLALPAPIQE